MMTIHTAFGRLWRTWLTVSLLAVMAGCATGPKLVSHSFNYDGFYDKWADKVDLLAYSYGDQYPKLIRKAAEGMTVGAQGLVNGPIPVGEFLYVKWRIKATGEVLEQRVDLRDRLPRDMSDHELTFLMDGRQLYVYVVTPRRKKSFDEPPFLKTWRSEYAHAYEIFPHFAEALRVVPWAHQMYDSSARGEMARLPLDRAAMEEAGKHGTSTRYNFFAAFDGTNNDQGNLKLSGDPYPTNVGNLDQQAEAAGTNYFKRGYYPGVGTGGDQGNIVNAGPNPHPPSMPLQRKPTETSATPRRRI